MAATQAFLANRTSQANLSATAAAAALRNLTPTPTPVEQVQTKRMIQKQASLSNISTSARGRRGGLQRQSSHSSMTERTFRTPSPSPSRQSLRPEPLPHPPVPRLPEDYTSSPTTVPKPKKSKQRPASHAGPPPPSQQANPVAASGWNDPSYQQPASPLVRRPNDLERTDSRNSINFSRPLSPRPQSPIAQSSPVSQPPAMNGDRFPPNAAAAISLKQAEDIQYGLSQAANQPVKKKKKKVAGHAAEGSHLHEGTMASRPVVTPLEPGPERQQSPAYQDSELQAPIKKKKKRRAELTGESSHFPSTEVPRTDSDSDSNIDRNKEKRAQRASGTLQKQPSIVKEDWEGEQQEQIEPKTTKPVSASDPTTNQRTSTIANSSRKMEEPLIVSKPAAQRFPSPAPAKAQPELANSGPQEAAPLLTNNLRVQEPVSARGSSLSPSRSTRFSDRLSSDLALGRKHEPLPRSISPAKSALKHHSPAPSGSPSDPNALRPRGASVTPSESSDISTADADAPPRRKKSVRVSFDAEPEVVGVSFPAQTIESPNKDKKGWLGLGKNKPPLTTIPSNDDMEELMKPRPQLPSFGSVRGQMFRDGSDTATSPSTKSTHSRASMMATESKPEPSSIASSDTSSSSFNPAFSGVSNDHAVGAVFAQEAQRKAEQNARLNEPLPPEVTSVEGGVSYSDTESEASEDDQSPPSLPAANATVVRAIPTEPEIPTPAAAQPPPQREVPIVAVSPPTPALEQSAKNDQWQVEVPGGFPISSSALAQLNQANQASSGTGELAFTPGQGNDASSETDSDNDSIYSDAAEDPSEMEGTGFGSIDAIVDSPIITTPIKRSEVIPESPLSRVAEPRPLAESQPGTVVASWEESQARWRRLAEQSKQGPLGSHAADLQTSVQDETREQAQPNAPQPSQLPAQESTSRPVQTKKKKKKSAAEIAALASVPVAAQAARGSQLDSPVLQKGQTSSYPVINNDRRDPSQSQSFRQSMRNASPPTSEPHFKQSMRNQNRNSLPATGNAPPKQKRYSQPPNPPSVHAQAAARAPTQPRAALQKKHIPSQPAAGAGAASAVTASRVKPGPVPVNNDSDSESSFRKARRSKSNAGGKYTMRRSMRGVAADTSSSQGSARNGVRSVSPVGRRQFSPAPGPRTMRTSMRSSMDNTPTLRGPIDNRSSENKRSASLFGRRPKSPPPAVPAIGGQHFAASRSKSRVVDSDDEGDAARRPKFRSRFADDSDDEPDTHYTPVRGIPRRANDSDSTDLEDSSDEEKVAARTPPKLAIPANAAQPVSGEPLSPNSEKKRGLFGRFRSKKPKDEALSPVVESPKPVSSKPSHLGFSSGSERDRIIAETQARLEEAKYGPAIDPAASSQGHAKLQRRHQPQRVMSDSWPLPPKIPDHLDNRPGTAESAPVVRNGTTRLAEGSMRTGTYEVQAVGRSGKKKRFPMLRKAFGLKD
ncbi:hypothetical protein B0A52_04971 [Exophiala mesophila]|uniref:Uncharacterized protein n=1 Tax=Exophiala mesophila TaxID=212818 RepID=A0A438N6L8_EXOME|nr:hypothetical protein B0A52_04971 [Exophiala mesophila]